jgi:hypothetical protein
MNLQPIFDELFNPIVMSFINSDHHKTKDKSIDISYNDYTQEWYIVHTGYVR